MSAATTADFRTNGPPALLIALLDNGERAAFRRSWCSFDRAFNDLLAGGSGGYTRPHTMSDGDPCFDMTWQIIDAPKRHA